MPSIHRPLGESEFVDGVDGDDSITYVILRAAPRISEGRRHPDRAAGADARSEPALTRRVLPLALVLALAATAGAGFAAARGGSSEDARIHPAMVPGWFLPIADAYDRNPAITPATDFAAFYDARPATYARLTTRHGRARSRR